MTIDRRALLKSAAALSAANAMPRLADAMEVEKADYTLRIATGLVELSPEHIVSTTLYNGQFPGPLLRFKEGQRVIVDIHNDTDTPELVHWHGQFDTERRRWCGGGGHAIHRRRMPCGASRSCRSRRDCASITPMSSPAAISTAAPTPGQAGPVYIEPADDPGRLRPRGISWCSRNSLPSFSRGGDMAMDMLVGAPLKELQEIGKQADEQAPQGQGLRSRLRAVRHQRQDAGPWRADPREAGRARAVPRAQCQRRRDPQPRVAGPCVSRSSRSTAIRCRRRRRCRCCGSAPPSASRRSSR